MNASIDFDAIRARNPLPEYCELCGIKLRRSGGSLVGQYPLHHEMHGAAFAVFDDGRWCCSGSVIPRTATIKITPPRNLSVLPIFLVLIKKASLCTAASLRRRSK